MENSMKITAGLGSIDEYERFVQAGADEFFCGYVPFSWAEKYGTVMPLNRREVLCYNVQLGAYSELEILSRMVKKYKKPVHLTFNSLYYLPEQYPEIGDIIEKCMGIGFRSYIIADPALLVYLKNRGISCEIHLSGETGEVNSEMLKMFRRFPLKRLIFHRKNTFRDMQSVIASQREVEKQAGIRPEAGMEFEAFVLNEMCQFTGAFCNSLHCDEMGYLCRVSYWLGTVRNGDAVPEKIMALQEQAWDQEPDLKAYDESGYLCGETGCGLCALYQLKQAGITHLKLVGRGNYVDHMEKDIRNLRKALEILDAAEDEKIRGELDRELHKKIAKIADNPMVYSVLAAADQLTENIVSGTRDYIMKKNNSAKEVDDQHHRLVEAIINGDAEQAERCMSEHMDTIERYMEEMQKKS